MKIRINGETFDWDGSKTPLSEALEIEKVLGVRYAQWESDFNAGSMRALAGFVWKVWRRDGRDVALADVIDGKVDVDDVTEVLESLVEAAEEVAAKRTAEEEAPKEPTGTDQGGTPTTGTGTRASSRKGSASAPGK